MFNIMESMAGGLIDDSINKLPGTGGGQKQSDPISSFFGLTDDEPYTPKRDPLQTMFEPDYGDSKRNNQQKKGDPGLLTNVQDMIWSDTPEARKRRKEQQYQQKRTAAKKRSEDLREKYTTKRQAERESRNRSVAVDTTPLSSLPASKDSSVARTRSQLQSNESPSRRNLTNFNKGPEIEISPTRANAVNTKELFRDDMLMLTDPDEVLNNGLMLMEKDGGNGRMVFWLGELPLRVSFETPRGNTVTRISKKEVELQEAVAIAQRGKRKTKIVIIPPLPVALKDYGSAKEAGGVEDAHKKHFWKKKKDKESKPKKDKKDKKKKEPAVAPTREEREKARAREVEKGERVRAANEVMRQKQRTLTARMEMMEEEEEGGSTRSSDSDPTDSEDSGDEESFTPRYNMPISPRGANSTPRGNNTTSGFGAVQRTRTRNTRGTG